MAYDIILIIGQSNTHYGAGLDAAIDTPHDKVKQLGRFGANNLQIIPAVQPLDHKTKTADRIGIGLPFAKEYADEFLDDDREVLLIPVAVGGTAFIKSDWNKGDDYYQDAVNRFQLSHQQHPQNQLVAILWAHGESDADWDNVNYQEQLDRFIIDLRSDLRAPEVPFLLGGMVPEFAESGPEKQLVQSIIKDTPNRIENTYYVDPTNPFIIPADTAELVHFDAAGIREMAKRYWEVFKEL